MAGIGMNLPFTETFGMDMYTKFYKKGFSRGSDSFLERSAQLEQEIQAARAADKATKTMALAIAVLIGLIPPFAVGRRIIREKTWKENPGGTARALGAALAGGGVLFALNYGVILLKIKMGDAFNLALAFLIVGR